MNKKNEEKEQMCLKGVYRLTFARIESELSKKLLRQIEKFRNMGEKYQERTGTLIKRLNSVCDTRVLEFNNILPTVGRMMVANNLTNVAPTNVMYANYIALGTGTTAVNNADTKLVTESFRNQVASKTNALNIGYITGFYSATECNGTYKEAGIFCNGTSSVNTGVLLSRVLLNPTAGIAKTNIETLTLDWVIQIN